MPAHVVGEHAEQQVSPDSVVGVMMEGTDLEVDGLEAAEGALDLDQELVGTHHPVLVQTLRGERGAEHVDAVEGPYATGVSGVMVTCGGGPELLWLVRTIELITAGIVLVLLALVFVQTITGGRFLPLPGRPPLRPRLFALGVAIEAAAAGLVALEVLAPPGTAVGLLVLSNPLFIVGIVIMWYGRGLIARRSRDGGLWA